jgi:hypothetical protein
MRQRAQDYSRTGVLGLTHELGFNGGIAQRV